MKISQVALQLYTIRDYCKTTAEFAGSMKKVRAIGYQAVQISGIGPIPVADINSILDGEGLSCCATHEPGKQILSDPSAIIDRLNSLRCDITAYPYPDGIDFGCADSVNQLIQNLDAAGAALRAAGKTLAYHNHAIEFVPFGKSTVLETIYEQTSAQNLGAEIDTYWVQYGGANPVDWCEKMAGRLTVLHLKDYAFGLNDKPVMAEIGYGNIDFSLVIPAAEKSGCKWFVVEQDTCPGDPFDSATKSFQYIEANLVS